jgi:hypothetical protein
MEFSKNMCAHDLSSGILGAFLNTSTQQLHHHSSWLRPQLIAAAQWLSQHNCYLKPNSQLLSQQSHISQDTQPFPIAFHTSNTASPLSL